MPSGYQPSIPKVLEKEDKATEELHDSLDDAVNERAEDGNDKVEIIKKKEEEPVAAEAASLSVSYRDFESNKD